MIAGSSIASEAGIGIMPGSSIAPEAESGIMPGSSVAPEAGLGIKPYNTIAPVSSAGSEHRRMPPQFALVFAAALIIAGCTTQTTETTFNSQETKIATYASAVKFIQCEIETTTVTGDDGEVTSVSYTLSRTDTISPTVIKTNKATRLTIIDGDGDELTSSGSVTFYYAGYVFTSGPSTVSMMYLTLTDEDNTSHTGWMFSTPYSTFTVSGSLSAGAVISGSSSTSGLTIFGTNNYFTSQIAGWSVSDGDYEPMTISLKNSDLLEGLKSGLVGVKAGEVCDIVFSGKYGIGKRDLGTIPANSAMLFRIWVESISN